MRNTMKSQSERLQQRPALYGAVTAILACLSLTAAHAANPSAPVTVWADGDEFVQLAPQDAAPASTPPPNAHPVSLDAGSIASALARITIRQADESHSLFDQKTARRISAPLSKALSQASPKQDVLFAVLIWTKGALMGSNDVTVAGRAFFFDGRLHIIIGDLYRSAVAPEFFRYPNASRKIDRRVHPHVPGQRAQQTKYEDDARFESAAGIGLFQQDGKVRNDWLVLDLAALATSPPPATPGNSTASPSNTAPQATATPEERLQRLKRLREQNLINEDEYASKRKEILKDL